MKRGAKIAVNTLLVGVALVNLAWTAAQKQDRVRRQLFIAVETDSYATVRRVAAEQLAGNRSVDEGFVVRDHADSYIDGPTPIVVAVQTDKTEAVRALLDAGADINQPYLQKTLLSYAVATQDQKLVRLLVRRGAAVNPITNDAESPLYTAIVTDQPEMARLLLDAGADVCSLNTFKEPPFVYLAERKSAPFRALAGQLRAHPNGVWCDPDRVGR